MFKKICFVAVFALCMASFTLYGDSKTELQKFVPELNAAFKAFINEEVGDVLPCRDAWIRDVVYDGTDVILVLGYFPEDNFKPGQKTEDEFIATFNEVITTFETNFVDWKLWLEFRMLCQDAGARVIVRLLDMSGNRYDIPFVVAGEDYGLILRKAYGGPKTELQKFVPVLNQWWKTLANDDDSLMLEANVTYDGTDVIIKVVYGLSDMEGIAMEMFTVTAVFKDNVKGSEFLRLCNEAGARVIFRYYLDVIHVDSIILEVIDEGGELILS